MSKLREQPGVPTTFPTRRVRNPDAYTGDASRYHVGTSNGLHPEDRPYQTDERRRHGAMNRQPVVYNEDDTLYETRSHSSARRYTMPAPQRPQAVVRYHYQQIPPRSSRTQTQDDQPEPQPQRAKARRQWHWSVYVGLTMLVGVVLFIVGNSVVSWWHVHQDDATYGRPRTSQCDAVVGHSDSPQHPSHFIALNLNKHIEVIEFPGRDATRARIYIGPTLIGDGQELTPVTLEFRDVNGDGKPDMILHVGDIRYVFLNDIINGVPQFRPAKPTDTITL